MIVFTILFAEVSPNVGRCLISSGDKSYNDGMSDITLLSTNLFMIPSDKPNIFIFSQYLTIPPIFIPGQFLFKHLTCDNTCRSNGCPHLGHCFGIGTRISPSLRESIKYGTMLYITRMVSL